MTKMLPNGRAAGPGHVIVMRKAVFDTDEYRALSDRARTLLTFVHLTYSKYNNGSLRILLSEPRRYGFNSRDLLSRARDELIVTGWLQVTRLPTSRRMPWLYALTWEPINGNEADGIKGTRMASNLWRADRAAARETLGKSAAAPSRRRFAGASNPAILFTGYREAKRDFVPGSRETNSDFIPGSREAKTGAAL